MQSDFTFYTSSIYETMSDLFLVTRDNEINFNPSTVLVSSIQLDVKIREDDILDFTVYAPYDFQNIKVEVYSDVISFLNSRYDKNYIMGSHLQIPTKEANLILNVVKKVEIQFQML